MDAKSSDQEPIKVLVADNHLLARREIIRVLETQPDMIVAGEASNGLEALAQARAIKPDLVLMDVRMPHCNGIEATYLILHEIPQTKIIILTMSDDDQDLFQAIEAGAQGYLLKNLEPAVLVNMIRGVFKGKAPISRLAAGRIMREFARGTKNKEDRLD